jgi:queuosine precursor transporter
MRILFYLISIVTANVVTAAYAPLEFAMFIVPMALAFSALASFILGDTLLIVLASAISFVVAETADTEIYTRLKLPMAWRVFYSGIVGGFLDSVIFVVIGLSPLGANFLPWEAVPAAILGQIIVKTVIQMIGALILNQVVIVKEKRLLSE